MARNVLPEITSDLFSRGVLVTEYSNNTPEISRLLLKGTIDIAIATDPIKSNPSVKSRALYTEKYLVLLAETVAPRIKTKLDLQNYSKKVPCVQASSESYDLVQTSRMLRNLSISNVLHLNSIWANLHLINLGLAWGLETPFNVLVGSKIHQGCVVFKDLFPGQGTRTTYISYINPDFAPLVADIAEQILQKVLGKLLLQLKNSPFDGMIWINGNTKG